MLFTGSRATPHWRILYPKLYFEDKTKPLRSHIMMNSKIPTDQHKQIQFWSPNVLGIYLKTNKHNLIIINIYSDCNNNDTINAVREFLLTRFLDEHIPDDTYVILCGDFNCHHLWWEFDDNTHLTSSEGMICPLIELITLYDLHMALPPQIPTCQRAIFMVSNFDF